ASTEIKGEVPSDDESCEIKNGLNKWLAEIINLVKEVIENINLLASKAVKSQCRVRKGPTYQCKHQRPRLCYECRRTGHKARDCPNQKKKDTGSQIVPIRLKNFVGSINDITISTAITSEDVTDSFSRTCRPSPRNFVTTGLDMNDMKISTAVTKEDVTDSFRKIL
ncbi:16595_t:CDS:2, partial [Gigaspora rosea]